MDSDEDAGTLGSINKYLRIIKNRDSPHNCDDGISPRPQTPALSSAEKPAGVKSGPFSPRSHRSSISSTVSSTLTDLSDSRLDLQSRTSTAVLSPFSSSTSINSSRASLAERHRDPLLREYPKPSGQVDIDEMLTRPPGKWSLGHYFHKSRHVTRETSLEPMLEDRKGELEEAKKQLMAARNELRQLGAKHA